MRATSKSGRTFVLPTPEEDAAIAQGIAADPDTYEMPDEAFEHLRPRGRPKAAETKERITIRLSREVLESFRSTGAGWQTRVDEALREWVRSHQQK
jgi:uncharacterized protein (DUF4415 family)